jgi:hypothetical protein
MRCEAISSSTSTITSLRLSGKGRRRRRQHTSAYVSIRLSAYVSIRQHTSAYVSTSLRLSGKGRRSSGDGYECVVLAREGPLPHIEDDCCLSATSAYAAYVSIRQYTKDRGPTLKTIAACQHTSAYCSIRQHTSASERLVAHIEDDCCLMPATSGVIH